MAATEQLVGQEDLGMLQEKVLLSIKRTRAMFQSDLGLPVAEHLPSQKIKVRSKIRAEYEAVKDLPPPVPAARQGEEPSETGEEPSEALAEAPPSKIPVSTVDKVIESIKEDEKQAKKSQPESTGLIAYQPRQTGAAPGQKAMSGALVARRAPPSVPVPEWHAPWKLMRVISAHLGWVRSVAMDPTNEWFATGAADRTIKIWDLASGTLKLTLTGHINTVRGLAVSARHPYLFSCGEDKTVKCWDLEYNKVIRHYHGHLSGVFSLALHPTLDILISGGRDSVGRVWDMRSKQQIHVLGGHTDAVASILTQTTDPQVITGSHDNQIKLWDLAAGKSMATLTNHKKAVRALVMNPVEHTFVSGAADNLKKWSARDGKFLKNLSGHNAIVNTLAANQDNVLVSGADNGSLYFWDYSSGYNFAKSETIVQPGSLDSEAGIFASTFDMTGSRFITCEADKTIKIWKEDETATPETHPIDMKAWTKLCLQKRRY